MQKSSKTPKVLATSINGTTCEETERMSNLPDYILHNILSSLYIFLCDLAKHFVKKMESYMENIALLEF